MKITYDSEADALYIQLRPISPGGVENRDLGGGIVADYGTDGLLAGLEILDASLLLGKEDLDQVILELSPVRKMAALQD
ncbi:DUF2283 domain-containing protein [candidate division KSB1 bacterium]|nr:DUF2283 domain-containing protein [candidate division KSB1 bacterium]